MTYDDPLSRPEDAVDEIAQVHGARVDKRRLGDGTWIASIEHDDWAVTGSGFSEAQAYSNLIENARAAGRAN
jgi:hypothetical protein